MINANDALHEHTCSDNFYKYNFGLVISEGTLSMAQTFSCFWWIDIIASYQGKLSKPESFQVWILKRTGSSAVVTCTDGNDKQLISQRIPFTDFEPDVDTLWVEGDGEEGNMVCILPSEH